MDNLHTEFAYLAWSITNEKKINDLISLATLCGLDNESILLSIQYFYDIPSSIWKHESVKSHSITIPVVLASKFYELEPFKSSAIAKIGNVNFCAYALAEVLCLQELDYCLYRMNLVNTWVKIVKVLKSANKTKDECQFIFFCFLKILTHLESLESMNFDDLARISLKLGDMYDNFEHLFKGSLSFVDLKLKEYSEKIVSANKNNISTKL